MSEPTRSNTTVVFMDDEALRGVISHNLDGGLVLFGEPDLGERAVQGYVAQGAQTRNLNLTWYFTEDSADLILGRESDTHNRFLTSGVHDFIIRDTIEQALISGAYLSSFDLNLAVGETPIVSTSFSCNTVIRNTDTTLNAGEDTLSGEIDIFRPQGTKLSNITVEPFISYDSGCIQSANLSFSIPRKPVKKLGQRVPTTRAITEHIPIALTVDFVKKQVQTTNPDYLNELVRSTGTIDIVFENETNTREIKMHGMTLISEGESLGLEGNAAVSYNFEGRLSSTSLLFLTGLL